VVLVFVKEGIGLLVDFRNDFVADLAVRLVSLESDWQNARECVDESKRKKNEKTLVDFQVHDFHFQIAFSDRTTV
jgi:hypothetical protein